MDKIIPVWKPVGLSSFDVIRRVKQINPSLKVGHCGTLDPFAEGVLILCTGKLTKNSLDYVNLDKTYRSTFIFGEETDTLDKTGIIIKKSNNNYMLVEDDVCATIKNFVGDILQSPPAFSAKKIFGVKMYDLARKNIFIKRKKTPISIYDIKLKDIKNNKLDLEINCGKGTYIRSLARDIAYSLNTYAYVETLQRISIGEYDKDNSIKYKELNKCLLDMN